METEELMNEGVAEAATKVVGSGISMDAVKYGLAGIVIGVGGTMVYTHVIKPFFKKRKDKNTEPEVVEAADFHEIETE